jgi:hypothetical protein
VRLTNYDCYFFEPITLEELDKVGGRGRAGGGLRHLTAAACRSWTRCVCVEGKGGGHVGDEREGGPIMHEVAAFFELTTLDFLDNHVGGGRGVWIIRQGCCISANHTGGSGQGVSHMQCMEGGGVHVGGGGHHATWLPHKVWDQG